MTGEQWLEVVQVTVRELGELRFSQVLSEIPNYPAMSVLLKRENMEKRTGCGWPWRNVIGGKEVSLADQNAMATYTVLFDELAGKPPGELVDLIQVRRIDGLLRMLSCLEERFFKTAGELAKPADWRLVVLDDWWLRETAVKVNQGISVYLDATFFLELKPEEKVDEAVVVHAESR